MTEPDRHIDVYRVGLLAALYFDLRAIRNACGGWHAEHAYAGTRCGTGWTRRRALRDLRRHLDQIGAQQ
jgi:hypothetical protein